MMTRYDTRSSVWLNQCCLSFVINRSVTFLVENPHDVAVFEARLLLLK